MGINLEDASEVLRELNAVFREHDVVPYNPPIEGAITDITSQIRGPKILARGGGQGTEYYFEDEWMQAGRHPSDVDGEYDPILKGRHVVTTLKDHTEAESELEQGAYEYIDGEFVRVGDSPELTRYHGTVQPAGRAFKLSGFQILGIKLVLGPLCILRPNHRWLFPMPPRSTGILGQTRRRRYTY